MHDLLLCLSFSNAFYMALTSINLSKKLFSNQDKKNIKTYCSRRNDANSNKRTPNGINMVRSDFVVWTIVYYIYAVNFGTNELNKQKAWANEQAFSICVTV